MAPYRAATGTATAPTLAAVLSAIAAAWHPWITIALAMLVLVQVLDILSGEGAAKRRGDFDRKRRNSAVADKLLRDTQILMGFAFDAVLLAGGITTFFMFGGGATAYLLWTEGRSVLRNLRSALGKDAVWPGFDQASGKFYALSGETRPPPESDR